MQFKLHLSYDAITNIPLHFHQLNMKSINQSNKMFDLYGDFALIGFMFFAACISTTELAMA
jgi:hypothetical protein